MDLKWYTDGRRLQTEWKTYSQKNIIKISEKSLNKLMYNSRVQW